MGPGWFPHRGSADHWLQHGESNLSLGDLRSDSNAGGTLGATPDGSRSWERLGNAIDISITDTSIMDMVIECY